MDTLWQLEEHTEAKHRLYKRYLDAWWPIMLQRPTVRRVTYVDAFSGPGQYLGGEDGSPVFALDRLLNHRSRDSMGLSRERVTIILIEGRRDRYEHLRNLLHQRFGPIDQLPVNVIVKHGRAEIDTLPLLANSRAWGAPILAVFDSWGNVGVPWGHLRAIAGNRESEAIVTFGSNWFSRRESEDPEKLDEVFGGKEHWRRSDETLSPRDRWRSWLETYRSAMLRAGFNYSLTFQVVPRTGLPLDLVFGTGHHSGVEAFKDAMWKVDKSDGMRFSDPRTTVAKEATLAARQPSLWEDPEAPNSELVGFVAQCVEDGPVIVEQVREFLLSETARWLPKHADEAVRYLINEGRVTREPQAGRLTRQTRLAWVS